MIPTARHRSSFAVATLILLAVCGCRLLGRRHQAGADIASLDVHAVTADQSTSMDQPDPAPEPPVNEADLEVLLPSDDEQLASTDSDHSWFSEVNDQGSTETGLAPALNSPVERLQQIGVRFEYDPLGQTTGIDFTEADISATTMQDVAKLTELKWIDLRAKRVTDHDLSLLRHLPRLELLALGETLVTDVGLKHLEGHQTLRFLLLDETGVTDAGLSSLAKLPQLEGVSLLKTSVTQQGADELKAQTPDCRVLLDDDAPIDNSTSLRSQPPGFFPPLTQSHSQPQDVWPLDSQSRRAQPSARAVPRASGPISIADTRHELTSVLQRKLLDPEILTALGQHLTAQGRYGEAAKTFEAALISQPNNDQARFGMGIALAHEGSDKAALRQLATVIGEASAHYNMGVIAYKRQQPSRSLQHFEQAVALQPDFAEAREWLQRLHREDQVSRASHTPTGIDEQAIIDLLLSSFGGQQPPSRNNSSDGIQIIPATQRADSGK